RAVDGAPSGPKPLSDVPGAELPGPLDHDAGDVRGRGAAHRPAGEQGHAVDPNADYDKTVASIRAVAESYPGLYRDVQSYLNERIEEVLTGAKEPIVV